MEARWNPCILSLWMILSEMERTEVVLVVKKKPIVRAGGFGHHLFRSLFVSLPSPITHVA